jgi:ankyrin repeat protein
LSSCINLEPLLAQKLGDADFNEAEFLMQIDAHKFTSSMNLNVIVFEGDYWEPALHLAIACEELGLAKLLIDTGSDVNIRSSNGDTALMHFNISIEGMKLLISAGADLDAKNKKGRTALHDTVEGRLAHEVEKVKLLVEARADLDVAETDEGRTPLLTALFSGYDQKTIDMVKLLIDAGADVNVRSRDGYTALMAAQTHYTLFTNFSILAVQLLVIAGADLNAKGNKGYTALHMAVRTGRVEIVKFLVAAGANLGVKDERGDTTLAVAKENLTDYSQEIIQFLVAAQLLNSRKALNANPDVKHDEGKALADADPHVKHDEGKALDHPTKFKMWKKLISLKPEFLFLGALLILSAAIFGLSLY